MDHPTDQDVETANAAAIHQEAVEKSRLTLTDNTLALGLEKFFDTRIAKGRFLDTGRIPFICDDVRGLHSEVIDIKNETFNTREEVKEIKGMIWKFIWAMLSLLALILIGLGAWAFAILVHVATK